MGGAWPFWRFVRSFPAVKHHLSLWRLKRHTMSFAVEERMAVENRQCGFSGVFFSCLSFLFLFFEKKHMLFFIFFLCNLVLIFFLFPSIFLIFYRLILFLNFIPRHWFHLALILNLVFILLISIYFFLIFCKLFF